MEDHNEKDFVGDIELIKFGANDPTLLVQNITQTPTSNGYVEYGEGDNQFQYLLDIFVNSPTHNAIVNSVAFMTFGKGLNVQDLIEPDDLRKYVQDWGIFGNAALQVTATDIYHMPVNFVRATPVNPETNEVEWYKFSTDFEDQANIVDYPAWTKDWKPTEEYPSAIYFVKTYTPNAFYYGIPSFQSALNYCEQEVGVAKFITNYIRNNFSVTVLVNFNNGTSDPKSRKKNKAAIKKKYTGVDGDTIIVAHNKSKDHAATIETVSVPNASEQYEYVSSNARSNIIVAHQIVSPLLVGIRDDSTGLSSNSNEMVESRLLLEEMKIEPNQGVLAFPFNEIRDRKDVRFISSAPEPPVAKPGEEVEVEPVELKKATPELLAFVNLGEEKIEGYNLLCDMQKEPGLHDFVVDILDRHFEKEPVQFARAPGANPELKSAQDKNGYLVRYRYDGNKLPERSFCRTMMGANKLYRKEDIVAAGEKRVNPGFGMRPFPQAPYSIWNYQGGGLLSQNWKFGTCKHFWTMEVYVADPIKSKSRVNLGEQVSIAVAARKGRISPLQNPVNVHTSNWDQSQNKK